MKSGIEIVGIWEKEFHLEIECNMRHFLIEAIEAGLNEAYEEGKKAYEKHRLREDGEKI